MTCGGQTIEREWLGSVLDEARTALESGGLNQVVIQRMPDDGGTVQSEFVMTAQIIATPQPPPRRS